MHTAEGLSASLGDLFKICIGDEIRDLTQHLNDLLKHYILGIGGWIGYQVAMLLIHRAYSKVHIVFRIE